MSAIDECEPQVITAFAKAGWAVDKKPFFIRLSAKRQLRADIRFRRPFEIQEEVLIVVEVKCFTNAEDDLLELYRSIGQYEIYRAAMRVIAADYPLYLSIPAVAYARFLERPEIMLALSEAQIKYVIIDIEKEEILEWNH